MSTTSSKTGVAYDTEAITPLRQRMIEDMTSRKFARARSKATFAAVKRFAAFLERSPDTATLEDIRRFPAAPGGDRREHLHAQLL